MTIHPPVRVLAAAAAAAALAVSLGLSGCASAPAQPMMPERTSEAPNAIDVALIEHSLTIHFSPGEETPRAGQVSALGGMLASGAIGPGDKIRIERGAGALAEARARALASVLSREGLNPVVSAPGGGGEGELRLVVEHAVASVPGCPNWSKPPADDFANTMHSNYGCAAALDLAAMIADPRDLVEGRRMGPQVGDPAEFALHNYRQGLPERAEGMAPSVIREATTLVPSAPAQRGPTPTGPAKSQ